jgi:hypothetical protein
MTIDNTKIVANQGGALFAPPCAPKANKAGKNNINYYFVGHR